MEGVPDGDGVGNVRGGNQDVVGIPVDFRSGGVPDPIRPCDLETAQVQFPVGPMDPESVTGGRPPVETEPDGCLFEDDAQLITLRTTQGEVTILANPGVANFAVLVDNSGNSNDVTVTVKNSTDTTTFYQSTAAGNTIGAGKICQLTCVGRCWTLAEFELPGA